MVQIQAFRGIRYDLTKVGDLSDVVAPPYDVIDPELQSVLYERHPNNVVRLILNRAEQDDTENSVYERAATLETQWRREGVLALDSTPAVFVYHQQFEFGGQQIVRRGFVSRVRLEPFGAGTIHPHEETHAAVREDRLRLLRATRTNLSQIFGFYLDDQCEVQALLESGIGDPTPWIAEDHLGVVHKLWQVTDEALVARVAQRMADRNVYVADGHHRYETACNYRQELSQNQPLDSEHPANYVLMMLAPSGDPGMVVLPTHRLFRGVPQINSQQLLEMLGAHFELVSCGTGVDYATQAWTDIYELGDPTIVALFTTVDETWHLIRLTELGANQLLEICPDRSPAWRRLGVAILHELIVKHLLRLSSLPTPLYVHSESELMDASRRGDVAGRDATGQMGANAPFNLCAMVLPATLDDICQVSAVGERMPAKSTYFYPKLLTGLVFNPLD